MENPTATKRKRTQHRAKEDCPNLFDVLLTWRNKIQNQDFSRQATWIIDDKGLVTLSKIHPGDVNTQTIVDILQETPEWQNEFMQPLLDTIKDFDRTRVKNAIHAARIAKRARELPSTTIQ